MRFDAAGNWQTLDVLDDGRVVVAPAGPSGTTSFSAPTARTVQMNLHPTPNSGFGMLTHWTEERSRMNWKSYGTEFVLYRTQTEVSGP